jgi:hypothetical protein
MGKHTAENVLKKTFEHLDKILNEKNREAGKRKEGQQKKNRPSENNNKGKEKLTPLNGK